MTTETKTPEQVAEQIVSGVAVGAWQFQSRGWLKLQIANAIRDAALRGPSPSDETAEQIAQITDSRLQWAHGAWFVSCRQCDYLNWLEGKEPGDQLRGPSPSSAIAVVREMRDEYKRQYEEVDNPETPDVAANVLFSRFYAAQAILSRLEGLGSEPDNSKAIEWLGYAKSELEWWRVESDKSHHQARARQAAAFIEDVEEVIARTQVPTTNSPAPRADAEGVCIHCGCRDLENFDPITERCKCGCKCEFPSVSVGETVAAQTIEWYAEAMSTLREMYDMVQSALSARDALLISRNCATMLKVEAVLGIEHEHKEGDWLPVPPENRNDDDPAHECDGHNSNCPPRVHDHKL